MNPKTAVLGLMPVDCRHSYLQNLLLVTKKCITGSFEKKCGNDVLGP